MQGRGGADLLAAVVIIGAAQAVQGAGGAVCCCMRRGRWGAGGAVCWRGDLVQVVQGGGIIGAARGAGLLLAVVVIIGAAQAVQGAGIIGAAQAVQGAGGAASSGRPPTSSTARAKRKSPGRRRRWCACRSGLVSSVLVCR